MNEQRASIPYLPGFLPHKQNSLVLESVTASTSHKNLNFPDDSFFEMIMKSQVKYPFIFSQKTSTLQIFHFNHIHLCLLRIPG